MFCKINCEVINRFSFSLSPTGDDLIQLVVTSKHATVMFLDLLPVHHDWPVKRGIFIFLTPYLTLIVDYLKALFYIVKCHILNMTFSTKMTHLLLLDKMPSYFALNLPTLVDQFSISEFLRQAVSTYLWIAKRARYCCKVIAVVKLF